MNLSFAKKNSYYVISLFIISTTFCFLCSILIQNFLIPDFFNYENGLITLDAIYFHNKGIEFSKILLKDGMSAFVFKYENNFMNSLMGLLYYLFYIDPFLLLPLNALIHGLTASFIFLILRHFFEKKISFFATFFFIFNPQTFEWTSQIHKDGIFCLGFSIFTFFALNYTNKIRDDTKILAKEIVFLMFIALISIILIWIARGHFLYLVVLVICFKIFLSILLTIKNKKNFKKLIVLIIVNILLLLYARHLLIHLSYLDNIDMNLAKILVDQVGENSISHRGFPTWQETPFIPNYFENFMYRISIARYWVILLGGTTLIDSVLFFNFYDFLIYLPNAFSNALLSPYPKFWYGEASTEIMVYAKIIMGILTIFSYSFLLFFIYFIYKYYSDPRCIMFLIIVFAGLLIVGYSVPNTGTLMRYRFIFYILINCFGIAILLNNLLYKLRSFK